MKKSIVTGILFMSCLAVFAEPEIRGTATELAHYINEVPKTVMVTGEAEVRVPAHRAVLSLRVVTETKSLQESMRSNLEVRGKLIDYLKGQGISADRIASSKFSSTPKFGMFSEKAKSYRLENEVRVSVEDEKEFQAAAGAVDKWSEVQFSGVEFEYADKEQQKQTAIARACDNAGERKKIYEEKLGLKLVPAKFDEGSVGERNAGLANSFNPGLSTITGIQTSPSFRAYDVAGGELVTSFGEIVYTARVSVEYTVQTK